MTDLLLAFVFALALVPSSLAAPSSSEQAEIVNLHNEMRRGVQPTASDMLKMSWNREAASNAQKWANGCSMNPSPPSSREISTSGCGENLYMSSNKRSWSEAIQSWYDEVEDYRYGVGAINGGMIGHYTQVVWYRSNAIGCGMAYCPNSRYKYFYVCQYCPPGNYQYKYPYKSGRTCGSCPNDCVNKLCTNPCPYADKYSNCADLVENNGCNGQIGGWCPASCKCTNQII